MYQMPDFEEVRADYLRDVLSVNPNADISPDSDHFVQASAIASCATGQYAHQAWIVRQIFPDTADTPYLERHASLRNVRRRNPTVSAGTLQVKGLPNTMISAGREIVSNDSFYVTTEAGQTDDSGSAIIKLAASSPGSKYNIRNQAAKFMAAPAGIETECHIIETVGGTDQEKDDSLLSRLLEIMRRPPAGGNRYDYRNWAMSVDGVTRAYVYPIRRGLGTVDIVITSGNTLPTDEVVAACQAYIDDVRPVTAKDSLVIKPSQTLVDITAKVKLDGIDLVTATSRIKSALEDYFINIVPGDELVKSQIEAIISDTEGVIDRELLTPNSNLVPDMDEKIEWFMLGNVTIRPLGV